MDWFLIAVAALVLYMLLTAVLVFPKYGRRVQALKEEARTGIDAERWRALPPERRRAITLALRRGEPVEDPAEAEAALESFPRYERMRRSRRTMTLATAPLMVAFLLFGFYLHMPLLVILAIVVLVFSVATEIWLAAMHRRVSRAVSATEDLHPTLVRP